MSNLLVILSVLAAFMFGILTGQELTLDEMRDNGWECEG